MRAKRSFDEKCYELAEYFMEEPKAKWTDEDRTELAAVIQRAIEDFMHEEEDEVTDPASRFGSKFSKIFTHEEEDEV